MYDIYSNARKDQWRFSLGKSGGRQLFVIGLNPSTANREKSDTTVAKVERVAELNGFDGFVMLNLYPVRSTDYNALSVTANAQAYTTNLDRIEELTCAEPNPQIWAAWGESIGARDYFRSSAAALISRLCERGASWLHFGPLTNSGHPRHPSRLQYAWSLAPFDAGRYAQSL